MALDVLVVDDEADIRELVRINLELDGHRVLMAQDGPTAVEAVKRETPDLVLLDVMMPGASGLSVIQRLRQTLARLLEAVDQVASDREFSFTP